jgi:hypothetical protein
LFRPQRIRRQRLERFEQLGLSLLQYAALGFEFSGFGAQCDQFGLHLREGFRSEARPLSRRRAARLRNEPAQGGANDQADEDEEEVHDLS